MWVYLCVPVHLFKQFSGSGSAGAKSCTQFREYTFFDVRRNGLEKFSFWILCLYTQTAWRHTAVVFLQPMAGKCARKKRRRWIWRGVIVPSLSLSGRQTNGNVNRLVCVRMHGGGGQKQRSSFKCVRAPSEVRKNIGACVCLAFKLPLFFLELISAVVCLALFALLLLLFPVRPLIFVGFAPHVLVV